MQKEQNQQLNKLVEQIKQSQLQSSLRIRLINQLLCLIQKYRLLSYYRQLVPDNLKDSYEEIYAEAQQHLFCWISKNIGNYDSKRAKFMTWVNNKLRYIMLDVIKEFQQNTLDPFAQPICSLDDLDHLSEVKQDDSGNQFLSEKVINIIQKDPEGKFKQTYPTRQPKANFKFLCLRRYEGYQWQELSEELNLPIPSLSNFYQRKLKEFAPLIQYYLQE